MYEDAHFSNIQQMMKRGDLFFDIGACDGQTSVLIADQVGPENVVIIEPAEKNWSYIMHYWGQHFQVTPRGTYAGFLEAQDKAGVIPQDVVHLKSWPNEIAYPMMDKEMLEFRWLHYIRRHPGVAERPRLKLDTLVTMAGVPKGFTLDVEGSELLVLKGAEKTLREAHPLVWVSIHPLFMKERFQSDAAELHAYMKNLGYKETLLANDHEEHWLFQ